MLYSSKLFFTSGFQKNIQKHKALYHKDLVVIYTKENLSFGIPKLKIKKGLHIRIRLYCVFYNK